MLEFKREEQIKNKIDSLMKITRIYSFIRFVIAVMFIVFAILALSNDIVLYGILTIVSLLIFIVVILLTNGKYRELRLYNHILDAYKDHKKRRNNKYASFFDTGIDLIDKNDYKEADLDLFGKHSLYQYLNVGRTKYGRQKLKDALVNGSDINYAELSDKLSNTEDSLELEGAISLFSNKAKNVDNEALFNSLGTKIKFNIRFLIPVLSFVATLVYLVLIFALNLNPYFILIFLILNYGFCRFFLANEVFALESNMYYDLLDNYLDLSKQIKKIDIDSDIYKDIKAQVNNSYKSIKDTKSILNLLAFRKNAVFNAVSNTLLIFDLWIIVIYNIKTKAQDMLKPLFESVGTLECALSFANIGIDNLVYTTGDDADSIEAELMYHPLVKDCVANSFNLDSGVILTGSNMSGKTTFMRTLGICQTLFNAKALIPAVSYKSKKLPIYTSLRANDMLSEGISTFYAEILRMKDINEGIKNNTSLILVDEIFKGTNAIERLEASNKVIDKLNDYKQLFIISTHDFELCDAKNITNYHFNEEYNDDKISFDYKIKEGKSETKNAIYLLKMANIIE